MCCRQHSSGATRCPCASTAFCAPPTLTATSSMREGVYRAEAVPEQRRQGWAAAGPVLRPVAAAPPQCAGDVMAGQTQLCTTSNIARQYSQVWGACFDAPAGESARQPQGSRVTPGCATEFFRVIGTSALLPLIAIALHRLFDTAAIPGPLLRVVLAAIAGASARFKQGDPGAEHQCHQ